MADEGTIYATRDSKHFYFVPAGVTLPPGELELGTLTGTRTRVDAEAAKAYEIPEDQAKQLVQAELSAMAKKAGGFLANAAATLREAANQPTKAPQPPNVETLAAGLGIEPDDLQKDPQKVLNALSEVLKGMQQTVRESLSKDPVDREAAKKRMQIVAEQLRAHGVGDPATTVEAMPEKIREVLEDPKLEQAVREATEKLKLATQDLQEWANNEKVKPPPEES
jgi:hypothetical protein